jgi:O-antigen/teichoic acid export membrane protein
MAFAQILASSTNVGLIVLTVVVLNLGIQGLIISRLTVLLIAILYQMAVSRITMRPRFSRETARGLVGFGFFLGLNNILSFIFMRIDTLIIGAVMNPVGVALYGTALKIPDASRQMFESFRSVFFPNMAELFSRQKHGEAEAILNNSLRLVSFLSFFISLIIVVFQNELVKLLFSYKYLDCAPALSLLMVAMSIGLIGNILGTTLVAAGYSRLPVLINIVDATVCVIANLVLIPAFGIMGAAYAAIIARVATNPVNIYFLRKNGVNLNVFEFLKPAAVFGACWAMLAFGDDAVYKMLVVITYLVMSVCFLVVTSTDFDRIKKLFNRLPQTADSK